MKTKTSKLTVDAKGQALYLAVCETRDADYFHLTARLCTKKYDNGEQKVWSVDDDYSDGLLWSGLRASCQGDKDSRVRLDRGEPVYGYDVVYRDMHTVDLRRVRRMAKTLELLARGLAKLGDQRGSVTSYGEYLGRVAEAFGCSGMAFERSARSKQMSGESWEWMTVGDGVDRANYRIRTWRQEGLDAQAPRAQRQLTGGVIDVS